MEIALIIHDIFIIRLNPILKMQKCILYMWYIAYTWTKRMQWFMLTLSEIRLKIAQVISKP